MWVAFALQNLLTYLQQTINVKDALNNEAEVYPVPYMLYLYSSLRKHAYSNILKILPPKNENVQIKNSDIFHVSAHVSAHRGGSNEYPQSMFWAEIRKIKYTPVNPILLYESGV